MKGLFITFEGIEKGDYTLQEIDGVPDYLQNHIMMHLRVNGDGTVTITGLFPTELEKSFPIPAGIGRIHNS